MAPRTTSPSAPPFSPREGSRPNDVRPTASAGRPHSADYLAGGGPTESTPPDPNLTSEGRRERHRRETFERLVRAARQIMFSRGFSDITVQDITDAADVGKGTFFNYFRSKEHIVTRVQDYNRRGLLVALERVRGGGQTPQGALTDILTWLLCPSGGEWLTYQSNTMRALALYPEVREYFSPVLTANLDLYTQIMELGQQHGNVRTDVPAAELARLAQTYFAGITVMYWIHGIAPTPPLVADLVRTFFATLNPCVAGPATAAPPQRASTSSSPRAGRPKASATRGPRRRAPSPTTRRR